MAAMALERLAAEYLAPHAEPAIDGLWHLRADGVLDLLPLLTRLFELADSARSAEGAALFHLTLAAALADWIEHQSTTLPVLLGGGCFANRLLSARLTQRLSARGLPVFSAQAVSCGDAGLALGQAWVAAHWRDPQRQPALPLKESQACA
nr:hypothetical protein [Pseudomonas sp. K2]